MQKLSKNHNLILEAIKKIDVIVIGGGTAGVAAAVSASKTGKSVALLERNPFLGGKATSAFVGTICGLYYRNETKIGEFVCEGFAKEFTQKLQKDYGPKPVLYKNGLQFLPYQQFQFKRSCDYWIQKSKTQLFLNSTVHSVNLKNNRISEVVALVHDRNLVFQPKMVIDCSGEAIISELANLEIIKSDEYQAGAQVFTMINIDKADEKLLNLALMKHLRKAILEGILSEDFERVSIVPRSFRNDQVVLKIGIPKVIDNRENKFTEIAVFARKMVETLADFLITNISFFKNAEIGNVASEIGIRTGRRHLGKYILTEKDVLNCRKFEDSAGRGSWPIEDWRIGQNPKMAYFEMNNYYDVPTNCLISDQLENLFFAGRNISADDGAIASARVIGTCLQTGEAAGQIKF